MPKRLLHQTLFRQTSPRQMQAFFHRFGYEMKVEPLPKRSLPRRIQNITPFVEAYNALLPGVREEMNQQIEDIASLASSEGLKIIEKLVPEFHYDAVWSCFQPTATPYHRVVDIWMNCRNLFDRALELFDLQQLKRHKPIPQIPKEHPEITQEILEDLQKLVHLYFTQTESRGQKCPAHFTEPTPGVYVFQFYPDDHKKRFFKNVNTQETLRVHETFAFPIAFAYDSVNGTLEIRGNLSEREQKDLADIFLGTLFGTSLPVKTPYYISLTKLQDRDFQLPAIPDASMKVILRSITVKWVNSGRNTTLGIGNKPNDTMTEVIDFNYHHDEKLKNFHGGKIVSALMDCIFPATGGRRQKVIKVELNEVDQKIKCRTPDMDCTQQIIQYVKDCGILQ